MADGDSSRGDSSPNSIASSCSSEFLSGIAVYSWEDVLRVTESEIDETGALLVNSIRHYHDVVKGSLRDHGTGGIDSDASLGEAQLAADYAAIFVNTFVAILKEHENDSERMTAIVYDIVNFVNAEQHIIEQKAMGSFPAPGSHVAYDFEFVTDPTSVSERKPHAEKYHGKILIDGVPAVTDDDLHEHDGCSPGTHVIISQDVGDVNYTHPARRMPGSQWAKFFWRFRTPYFTGRLPLEGPQSDPVLRIKVPWALIRAIILDYRVEGRQWANLHNGGFLPWTVNTLDINQQIALIATNSGSKYMPFGIPRHITLTARTANSFIGVHGKALRTLGLNHLEPRDEDDKLTMPYIAALAMDPTTTSPTTRFGGADSIQTLDVMFRKVDLQA